jgi:uncharacterized membrane protein YvlD (DUF360 family)
MINKYIATIISFFFPGIGEIVQGGPVPRNIGLFVLDLIFGILGSMINPILYIVSFIISIYAAYETYQMSE